MSCLKQTVSGFLLPSFRTDISQAGRSSLTASGYWLRCLFGGAHQHEQTRLLLQPFLTAQLPSPWWAFEAECFVGSHCYFLSFLSVLWTFSPCFQWNDFLSNSVNSNLVFPFSCWRKFLPPVIKVSSLHLQCQSTGPRGFFTLNSFPTVHPLKHTEAPLYARVVCHPQSWNFSSPQSPPTFPDLLYPTQQLFSLDLPVLDTSEKAMAPHSSTLAWEIPWTEEPGGLQSMGSLRVRHNWATSLSLFTFTFHFHFSLSCIGEGRGNPLQCSCLENPRDGGACWAAIYGVAQSRTWLKRLSSSSSSRHFV